MNLYVNMINDTIEYIERNISEKITLEKIAKEFFVSDFHFNRMFKTVVGITLKQYILGRKLTAAMDRLKCSRDTVIDIAYDFGFEYPEVFSRAFKKQFGVSPIVFRKEKLEFEAVNKASVVERDFIYYEGQLALKGELLELEELALEGLSIEVNTESAMFRENLESAYVDFNSRTCDAGWLDNERCYVLVNCHGADDGSYTVFHGLKVNMPNNKGTLHRRAIPSGWYACFIYNGDMFDIREAFVDALYRWIMVRNIELNPNGIGMLNIFEKDYPETHEVKIFVPVKKPV